MVILEPIYKISLILSWSLVLVGFATGALIGLQFHKDTWLGGYGSFSRRLLRLGHIACFGLPILNTLLMLILIVLKVPPMAVTLGVILWLVGQVTMPLLSFSTAFYKPSRHLFFIPVSALILGTVQIFYGMFYG